MMRSLPFVMLLLSCSPDTPEPRADLVRSPCPSMQGAAMPTQSCPGLDIFDDGTCTPAMANLACSQTVACDPPVMFPGAVTACCDGSRWITQREEPDLCGVPSRPDRDPDAAVDQGITDAAVDAAIDAGPQPTCPAPDPYTLSTSDVCSALDIFDPSTCTPAAQHATCRQLYPCDPPFEDPGAVVRCCDGETWRWVDEEPDLCGFPPQEPEAP